MDGGHFADVSNVTGLEFFADWLEYDWVGDNIYFAGGQNIIGLCNRVILACGVAVHSRFAPKIYGGAKFALDPTQG